MKNSKTYNTYVSITLFCSETMGKSARIYTSVESCKLDQHLEVEYRDGKRELAKLMLRFMKMPDVHHYDDGCTVYSINEFLD